MAHTSPRSILWKNATLADGASVETATRRADVLAVGGRISAIGENLSPPEGVEVVECAGRLLTPSLVDCHTHLVYAGNRANEFEMRLKGATYAEIAAAGGGIVASMKATRSATVDQLVEQSLPRLDSLLREGAGTVEVKSGYGLSVEAECNMLRAARKLETLRRVRIKTSWLAAHALPPEYKQDRAAYIERVVLAGLDQAHGEGLVDAVDGFCEHLAFTPRETERIFNHAAKLGLPVKLHAEQLSNQGGAALAARHKALSADHLEWLTAEDAAIMATAGTVAVLLPGAFYMLRETRLPPIAALRAAGATLALATDCNPGTSPVMSLLTTMNMGAVLFGLTVGEAFHGVTGAGAKALGLASETGSLRPGLSADVALWNAASLAELVNPLGFNPLHSRYFKGERVSS